MELQIPLKLNDDSIIKSKIISFVKRLFKYILFAFLFIAIPSVALVWFRSNNETSVENFVFNQVMIDMTPFVNPNQDKIKDLDRVELLKLLTKDKKITLIDYENTLAKFLIETEDLEEEDLIEIVKSYKIKLLEHSYNKLQEFNFVEKESCARFAGCSKDLRYEARKVIEENLKNKIKEKQILFFQNIIKLVNPEILDKISPENIDGEAINMREGNKVLL